MGKSDDRRVTNPEAYLLHKIVDRAAETDHFKDLTDLVVGWYKQHVDAHGFTPGADLGPPEPANREAPHG